MRVLWGFRRWVRSVPAFNSLPRLALFAFGRRLEQAAARHVGPTVCRPASAPGIVHCGAGATVLPVRGGASGRVSGVRAGVGRRLRPVPGPDPRAEPAKVGHRGEAGRRCAPSKSGPGERKFQFQLPQNVVCCFVIDFNQEKLKEPRDFRNLKLLVTVCFRCEFKRKMQRR